MDIKCQEAFERLKKYIFSPIVKKANPCRNTLYVPVCGETAVSSVLVLEEGQNNFLIHYVSKVLLDVKTKYTQLEQLVLTLIEMIKKLKHYF